MNQLGLFFSKLNTIFLYLIFMLNLSKYFENSFHSIYLFLHVSVLSACMFMYHMHNWCLWRLELESLELELQTAEATM